MLKAKFSPSTSVFQHRGGPLCSCFVLWTQVHISLLMVLLTFPHRKFLRGMDEPGLRPIETGARDQGKALAFMF